MPLYLAVSGLRHFFSHGVPNALHRSSPGSAYPVTPPETCSHNRQRCLPRCSFDFPQRRGLFADMSVYEI